MFSKKLWLIAAALFGLLAVVNSSLAQTSLSVIGIGNYDQDELVAGRHYVTVTVTDCEDLGNGFEVSVYPYGNYITDEELFGANGCEERSWEFIWGVHDDGVYTLSIDGPVGSPRSDGVRAGLSVMPIEDPGNGQQ